MSENIEFEAPALETTSGTISSAVTSTAEMVDTDNQESKPGATGIASDPAKNPSSLFRIWPPSERTREAVKNRLIETLSTPSILSKRYGTISVEDATEAAKLIEEEAFQAAGATASTDGDGIEILQVYSREISRRMLDTMKAKSGESKPEADNKDQLKEEESTTPPQSEKIEATVVDDA